MTWFVVFWGVFSLVAFLFFAIVEALALFNKAKGDTFSENIRNFFHTNTVLGRIIWCSSWGIFALWFFFHIAFGFDWF